MSSNPSEPLTQWNARRLATEAVAHSSTKSVSECPEMTASEADDIFIAAVVALDHAAPTSPYKEIFERLAAKYDFEKRTFAKRETNA